VTELPPSEVWEPTASHLFSNGYWVAEFPDDRQRLRIVTDEDEVSVSGPLDSSRLMGRNSAMSEPGRTSVDIRKDSARMS